MTADARWLASLEDQARARLAPPVFEYVAQGAREGRTTAAAPGTWGAVTLHPRVMRDVREIDLGVTLLGDRFATPVGIAPTTLQRAVHPDGELATARAAAEAGALVVVSSNAGTRFEEIGRTGARWWLQSYLPQDRALAVPQLERAVAAGARAVVLTVDTPVVGTKYAAGDVVWDVVDPGLVRVNAGTGHDAGTGSAKAQDLGPRDIAWVGQVTGLPVVVKGVLRDDDAGRCVDAGAAAVWVSNHGGRQLERAVATATALPAVVAAVEDAVPVYVDGGLRTGADVVTALALGASAAFVGRSALYALTDGAPGVRRMLAELGAQSEEAMRLCGCRTIADTRSAGLVERPADR